jgi:hypothetical protein
MRSFCGVDIKLNLIYDRKNAQTLLYYDNKVKVVRIQDLDGDDYTAILRQAKKAGRRLGQNQEKTEGNNE